jgi:CDP-archaeol synthase
VQFGAGELERSAATSEDKQIEMREFISISYLLSPLLFGLAFHGICIKLSWFHHLARPIDRGKRVRGKPLFGANKTYRGIVAVALGTSAGVGFQVFLHYLNVALAYELINYSNPAVMLIGLAIGGGAMLAELPNSLLKRQLGIPPGTTADGVASSLLFYVLDQVDMLIGIWAVIWPFVDLTLLRVLSSVVFLFIAHQLVTLAGYHLGMRSTPR